MNNVTNQYLDFYQPKSALLIYQHAADQGDYYIESYDIDQQTGEPINAHPLSIEEATALGRRLNTAQEKYIKFLVPRNGIMPKNVLLANPRGEGLVIWYTPPMKQTLYFKAGMGIKDGVAQVPALLWKASKTELFIFALNSKKRPKLNTPLFHSPLFNVNAIGLVCQGDVEIRSLDEASLEGFMKTWQDFFFTSRFSHLNGHLPVSVNPATLWTELIETGKPFPTELLQPAKYTLKSILP